jgi:hypothetical protein
MKVNPKDPIVKYAILEAHNFVCIYTGKKLNLLNCTIDHIIPQSFDNKPDILHKYIENYDGTFHINNLDNLVPATFDANVMKGGKQYDVNTVLFFMEQAKSKAPKILERIEKLRKHKDIERMLAIISSHIFTSANPKEEMSKLIEFTDNERGNFEERNYISDDQFMLSLSSVSIDAFLPRSSKEQGCCLLLFRSLFVSDCMITLNHTQIVQQLFKGLNTKPNLGKRGFIPFVNHFSPQIYYVQIGNNRFTLLENEIEELCEIVDKFSIIYIKKFKSLEQKYGTSNFRKINPNDFSVKMFDIPRHLWRMLVQFTWEFDYAKGETEWHIFSATNVTIVIYPENTILSRFYPVHSENYLFAYMQPDDMVCVGWEPLSNLDARRGSRVWDANEAFQWMTTKFIPYVIYYYDYVKQKKKWYSNTPTFDEFLTQFDINRFIKSSYLETVEQEVNEVSDLSDLNRVVEKLQNFFTCSRNIHVSHDEAKKTYQALSLLIIHTTLPDYAYNYIGGKLSCSENRSQSGIYQFLKDKINNINQNEYDESTLDLACRCMLEVMKHIMDQPSPSINQALLNELKSLLFPIWEKYKLENYISRMEVRL